MKKISLLLPRVSSCLFAQTTVNSAQSRVVAIPALASFSRVSLRAPGPRKLKIHLFGGAMLFCRVLVLCLLALPVCTFAQTTAVTNDSSTAVQATALIDQARLALTSGVPIGDITLTGSGAWTEGDTEQTGDVVIKVRGTTESRIDLTGATSRSEIRDDGPVPAGQWIDGNHTRHWMPPHNCWIPAGLILPQSLLDTAAGANAGVNYVGQESRGEGTADHIRFSRSFQYSAQLLNSLASRLSQIDIYLDATSHLPVSVRFTEQTDNDAERSIPAEIEFSDYRTVDGVLVPFHIHRNIGSLKLDVNVTSAELNKGIPDSDFALQ